MKSKTRMTSEDPVAVLTRMRHQSEILMELAAIRRLELLRCTHINSTEESKSFRERDLTSSVRELYSTYASKLAGTPEWNYLTEVAREYEIL